ncbi:MAG: peptidase M13, partial [Brooklawnia sp.]|nr:peptidase M13 [Brooklawnia sp.]
MTYHALTLEHFDHATRPTDDLFGHVNGGWATTARIPDDRSGWGAFYELRETSERQVREIVERCAVDAAEADPDEARIASL